MEDELSADRIRRLGLFDPGVVQELVGEHLSRRHNREGAILALLNLSVWHRLTIEAGAPAVYQ